MRVWALAQEAAALAQALEQAAEVAVEPVQVAAALAQALGQAAEAAVELEQVPVEEAAALAQAVEVQVQVAPEQQAEEVVGNLQPLWQACGLLLTTPGLHLFYRLSRFQPLFSLFLWPWQSFQGNTLPPRTSQPGQ